jgi:hypothetical protein
MKRAVTLVLVVCLCLTGMAMPCPTARADTALASEQVGQPMGKVWWPASTASSATPLITTTLMSHGMRPRRLLVW